MISGLVAVVDKVSILKDWSLWLKAKGSKAAKKKEDSLPGSQSASIVIVSSPFTNVNVLVSRLADPRLPLFAH